MPQKVDQDLVDAFIDDARDTLEAWEAACLQMERAYSDECYQEIFRCAHNLKGGSGLSGFDEIGQFWHIIEDRIAELKDRPEGWTADFIQMLLAVEEFMREWVERLSSDPMYVPAIFDQIKSLEDVRALRLNGGKETAQEKSEEPSAPHAPRKNKSGLETIRISAAKLDNIIQLLGELTLYQSMVSNSAKGSQNLKLASAADAAVKLTHEVHASALALRLFPLHGLFQRLERLAKDVSFDLKKQVEISKIGGEVTLDKLVIEGVSDALVHIIRNAIDHGLENEQDRRAAGKSKHGHLTLEAKVETHGVTIRIQDDGRGMDPEGIYQAALRKNLIKETDNRIHSDDDKLKLVFLPGFSTAKEVTDVSGRGVGMDVVAQSVASLGGQISIFSEIGIGTTFEIQLPTNLSIVDALVVKVDESQFAVPNQDLDEIINLRDYDIDKSGASNYMINLRGQVVPVKFLRSMLNKRSGQTQLLDGERSRPCLVVDFEGSRLAYMVDGVIGQQKVFVRPLDSELAKIPFVSGSTILSDGEPSMVLNMKEVAKKCLA